MYIIGFGLFLAPILGVCSYGIANLINTFGIKATLALCLSFPFYVVSFLSLSKVLLQEYKNIVEHTHAREWQFLPYEIISFICFFLLLLLASILGVKHIKNNQKEN